MPHPLTSDKPGRAVRPLTAAERTLNIPGVDVREQRDASAPKRSQLRFRPVTSVYTQNETHLMEGTRMLCGAFCAGVDEPVNKKVCAECLLIAAKLQKEELWP